MLLRHFPILPSVFTLAYMHNINWWLTNKQYQNKFYFCFRFSSTESTLSDSEFDLCDLHDVKFIPNVSSFVLESQENPKKSRLKKAAKTKCGHKLGKDDAPCAAVGTLADKSNRHYHKENLQQDFFPENYARHLTSRDDAAMIFNTGRLLPEFPELRDSYDQFCTTMSEHSSRDDLDGKLSNTGSGMSVLSELKSARGMRDSMYSSDESVHACKRRRKAILQEENADGLNHRWSMPEFAKLWKENWESDSDCYLTKQFNKNDTQSSNEQSTETCNTQVLSKRNLNVSLPQHLQSDVNVPISPNTEKSKSEAAEIRILGESKSCPSLVSLRSSTTYNAGDYDSSGFYDGSDEDGNFSSLMHSRTSVSTVKENPQWHGYKADLKDSGIYANEDVDSSVSVTEINIYPNDSGYSGMSSGTRYSPEGEETNFDQHEEPKRQPKDIAGNSKSQRHTTNGEICNNNHVTLDKTKDERCAQLMQEYIVNRTLDTYTPSSSFYRTSAV